jgi:radical SAM protein with 4Fe4S-binding SPASM domain
MSVRRLPIVAANLAGAPQLDWQERGVELAQEELPELSVLRFVDELPRFQAILRGELPAPVTVEIDPTNICSHRCTWCIEAEYISSDKNTLRPDVLLRVVREAAELGAKSIVWKGGGEPLLHPTIGVALELVTELGMRSGIITHGERIVVYREAIRANAAWVRVSLDAGSEEDHRRSHRGKPGAWGRALEGITAIADAVFVGVQFVVDENNWRGIVTGARAARGAGARYIQFKPVIRETVLDDDLTPRIDALIGAAREELDGVGGFRVLGNGTAKRQPPYRNCKGHHLVMIIGANGSLYACCSTRGEKEYSYGSLHEASLSEIWRGPTRKKVLAKIDDLECRAGCRARSRYRYDAYNEVFDYLASGRPHADFF